MEVRWKKYIPLGVIACFMVLAYLFDISQYFDYEQLKNHRLYLKGIVSKHPVTSSLLFIIIYVTATALSVPGGSLLSITGGFLFPQPISTIYVVFAATVGATCLFIAAKTAIGGSLKRKAGPMMQKMQAGFRESAANYLLFLRLVPLFPFWLVNLAPAFFGVKLSTFIWTTFVGIIPGAFVFTQAGVGLGSLLEVEGEFNIASIFTTEIKIALIALAIFALLPVFIKKMRGKKND